MTERIEHYRVPGRAREPATSNDENARTWLAATIYCHDDLRALSGLSLFRIRLRVTKRLKEFKTRRKELMESEGISMGRATTRVRREMGYKGNELKHQRVFRSQVWVEREKERRKWR